MRPIALLAHLDDIDLAIDALRARAGEVAEALKEPVALREARAAASAADADLARCLAVQSECEAVQQKATSRLTQAQSQLYSGRMRVPKELEDAERDVAQLRRQHGQTEDVLLAALIAAEAAAETVASRQAALARLSAEWEAAQASLRREQAQLAARLTAARTQQAAVRREAPPALLHTYDTLRPRRGGRAVARLDGDTCDVCLVATPPLKLQAARDGDELVYCENCGRLLWVE